MIVLGPGPRQPSVHRNAMPPRDVRQQEEAVSSLHYAIRGAFVREGIVIPFPQREVHVGSLAAAVSQQPGG